MAKLWPWRHRDELEVIVIGRGFNYHRRWFPTKLDGPINIATKRYTLDPSKLIIEDPGFFGRRRDWLRRVRYRFKMFFREGDPAPLGTQEGPVRSSELLFKIRRSNSIKMAFKTMFQKPFTGSRWILVVFIGVGIAVVAYMIYTGYITIPGVNV